MVYSCVSTQGYPHSFVIKDEILFLPRSALLRHFVSTGVLLKVGKIDMAETCVGAYFGVHICQWLRHRCSFLAEKGIYLIFLQLL